jgi:hypothetical protein
MIMIWVREGLVGLLGVLATAILAVVVEITVILVRWSYSSTRSIPGMSLGIDVVSIVRNRLLTPTGLTAGGVVFVLIFLLRRCRGIA